MVPIQGDPMLAAVNTLRQTGCTCGDKQMPPAEPLRWNELLARAARAHAADMSNGQFFSHTGSDGSSVAIRASKAGYKWSWIGENIAIGYSTISEVVDGWRSSPGHCRNMMNPYFYEMGAARNGAYWVQVFGSSR